MTVQAVRHQNNGPHTFLVVRRGSWRNLWRDRFYLVRAMNPADAANRLNGRLREFEQVFVCCVPEGYGSVVEIGPPGKELKAIVKANDPRRAK